MILDTTSPVPLYAQLAESLRARIARERWVPGRRLPSEHELCAAFGVTRPTVRQALDTLLREGRIAKRRGLGTFVAEPRPPVGLFSLTGTTEAFRKQRMKLTTRVLSVETVSECPLAGDAEAAGPQVRLERLRLVNRRSQLFERTWIAAALVPGLERMDFTDRSLYATLRGQYGLRVEGGRQRFGAVAADRTIAKLLRIKPHSPLLRLTRCMDLTGHPAALHVELFVAEGPFALEECIAGTERGEREEFAPVPAPKWGAVS